MGRLGARLVRLGLLPRQHDIALLRRTVTEDDREPPPPLQQRVVVPQESAIVEMHAALGHRIAATVLERRLRHGLPFVVYEADGQAVGSAWLVRGQRYVDELGWLFPIGDDEVWLRDVFVKPALRGRRVFSAIVASLISRDGAACQGLWSDVDWDNAASINAHRAAGFQVVARCRAWHWHSRILRGHPPRWPLAVLEIEARSRCLDLGPARLARHQSLLA